MSGDTWPSIEVARLAEWIAARTGLTFPVSRREAAAIALEKALLTSGSGTLQARLERDPAALDELLVGLTIGETYFFRHPEQIAVVRDEILPALTERKRTLRLWSAGCATGEEAYTLAMVAGEVAPEAAASVLGTDLSRARLSVARRGRYRAWSMRGVPESVVNRYFRRDGPWYELTPDIRSGADFRYLNLVDDDYASAGAWAMDVILCRNVLIYLDAASIRIAARKLLGALNEDGWLLLGASDPPIGELVDCEVVVTRAGLAYRRPSPHRIAPALLARFPEPTVERDLLSPPAPPPTAPVPRPPPPPAEPRPRPVDGEALRHLYAARRYAEVAAGSAALLERGEGDAEVAALRVRALANQGLLGEAGRACAAALDQHRDSAELLYLHALLLTAADLPREAVAAARRALYLDRRLVVAHLALGDALARSGDPVGAKRSLRNAITLLTALPTDEPVPASDGEVAGGLLRMTALRLELLDGTK